MTRNDANDSVGCVTTMDQDADRTGRIRWCACGQPWIPAVGLYGTTEETSCPACILRPLLAAARPSVVKTERGTWLPYNGSRQVFLWVIEECQRYAEAHPEHREAAQQIAVRVHRQALKEIGQ